MSLYDSSLNGETTQVFLPVKPVIVPVNCDAIPDEIKECTRWVTWKWELTDDRNDWTKPPYQIGGKAKASSTNPEQWGLYRHALATARNGLADGIGFVLGYPYAGIDLDDCRNPETGEIQEWAWTIIREIDTYSEISPSSCGIKMLVKATIPPGRNRKGDLEMYCTGRYFTITGRHLPGTPTTINDRQDAVDVLFARTFPEKAKAKKSTQTQDDTLGLEDQELLSLARRAKNGDKFTRLWRGEWEGQYRSQSEADQALCNLLAFYTRDEDQIDRLFRASGLFRDKWDRTDYREGTIQNALDTVTDRYGSDDVLTRNLEQQLDSIVKPVDLEVKNPSEKPKADEDKYKSWQQSPAAGSIVFEKWADTCTIADNQKEDWLIPYWAEFGCLHILTGLPFSGKSHLVAELVAAMATGSQFCEMPVQAVPLIVMDLENRERIIVKRIRNAVTGRPNNLDKLWYRINPTNIPRPVSTGYLAKCIQSLQSQTADAAKGLLIIDTMRSAFAGWGKSEKDNDDLAGLLYPLQAVAKASNWAIMVLHHNTKATNHYSGGTVIAGAADYLWNWTSDKKKLSAQLEMDGGRDDHQYPLEFRYDMLTQRNVYLGKSPELREAEAKINTDGEAAKWLAVLPSHTDEHITIATVLKLCLNCGMLDTDKQNEGTRDRMVRRKLQELHNLKYADLIGDGKNGNPYKYRRSEAGTSVMMVQQARGTY